MNVSPQTLYTRYCEAKKLGEEKIMLRKAVDAVESLLLHLKYDGSDELLFTTLVEEVKKLRQQLREKLDKYNHIHQEVGLEFISRLY